MPKPRFLAALALTVVLALAAGLFLGRSPGGSSSSPAAAAAQPAPVDVAVIAPAPAPAPQPQPQPQPPASQPPAPQPQPQVGPGVLEVLPEHIALPANQWSAQFTVANVGESEMAWFAVGVPANVSLSATQGVLAAGQETTVTATVDHTTLAKGPFSLKLHVSANDTAESVTITGTKQVKVNVPLGPGTLAAN